MRGHAAFAGRVASRHRSVAARVSSVAAVLRRPRSIAGTTTIGQTVLHSHRHDWNIAPRLTVQPRTYVDRRVTTHHVQAMPRRTPPRAAPVVIGTVACRRHDGPAPRQVLIKPRVTGPGLPVRLRAAASHPVDRPQPAAQPTTPAPVRPVPLELRRSPAATPPSAQAPPEPTDWGSPPQPATVQPRAGIGPGIGTIPQPADVGRITDLVVRAIDERLLAHRERTGRGWAG